MKKLAWIVLGSAIGCSGGMGEDAEPIGTTSEALSGTDPVSLAVAQSCTTTSVKGLSTQIVDEIDCIKPGTFDRIDNIPKASLGGAVFPFLQTPAKKALAAAIAARNTTMTINSAFRTVAQQYLLYAWYKSGRCGIGLAATPGTSNHEQGLAVDIEDNGGWNSSMSKQGFKWLGTADPVHFDYVGGGAVNWSGLDVEAFQRLWNRNHPSDTIAVDGSYGPETEKRLVKSPIGGFPIGAVCNNQPDAGDPPPDPKPDAGTPPTLPPVMTGDKPNAPDGPEPESHDAPRGCSASPSSPSLAGGALFALIFVFVRVRRRYINGNLAFDEALLCAPAHGRMRHARVRAAAARRSARVAGRPLDA